MHLDRSAVRLSRSLAAGLLAVATLIACAAAAAAVVTRTTAGAGRVTRDAASAGAVSVPVLHWRACGGGFQCATARVPLNYRHPRGEKISIAVIRHLATDPARRVGTLFFNPGGPGASSIQQFPLFYPFFPAQVRARFNIVSFDPRGVGYSTAIRCFPTVTAENNFFAALPAGFTLDSGFPVGAGQVAAWDRAYARFDMLCAQRNRALIGHVTTADVARDMDLLRRAVGAPMLNYFGISYGTVLGATYANLFPSKVGAMVLDGNLSPVAWTQAEGSLPTGLRAGADLASAATLRAFLRLCGQAPVATCAFSAGTPAATSAKFAKLLARLRRHPVTVGSPPETFTYAVTVADVVYLLYTTQAYPTLGLPGWQGGGAILQQLWAATSTQAPDRAPDSSPAAATAASVLYNGPEQQLAVICSDGPNPQNSRVYPALARLATARSGAVGPYWTWETEPCAGWPAAASPDRYAGPWNRPTAHPVLVIGNTGDPVTSYAGAVAMARLLGRARLLTVDGYGHTELLNPSSCAERYEVRYLLYGVLPPRGAVCRQNAAPF
jgi:pimeloyl-ACP methyl ester carboxylesterase